MNGRAAWLVTAEPIRSEAPKCHDNKMAGKFHIRLWIDQAGFRRAKVEVVSFEIWSAGLLIARAAQGPRIVYEAKRVDTVTWLPCARGGPRLHRSRASENPAYGGDCQLHGVPEVWSGLAHGCRRLQP